MIAEFDRYSAHGAEAAFEPGSSAELYGNTHPAGFMKQDTEEQAHALAMVHAEFILIHPFREGNGRCARLLAMLMGL